MIARVASWLEAEGGTTTRWESFAARAALFDPVRTVALPRGAAVVGVGGATLGGSGRTPLAIALTRALAEAGESVALVAHGHGGRARAPRAVRVDDLPDDVGDEAIVAARALASIALVFSGGAREGRLAEAARHARILVVDRLLQTRPARLARAILVHDDRPWGSGRLLPFGDLAAPRARLLAAADEVVSLGGSDARSLVDHAIVRGERVPLASLRDARLGLVTSMARPHRVRRALEERSIALLDHLVRADHARLSFSESHRIAQRARERGLTRWLLCPKSSIWLANLDLGAEVGVLDHRVELSASIVDRVRRCC